MLRGVQSSPAAPFRSPSRGHCHSQTCRRPNPRSSAPFRRLVMGSQDRDTNKDDCSEPNLAAVLGSRFSCPEVVWGSELGFRVQAKPRTLRWSFQSIGNSPLRRRDRAVISTGCHPSMMTRVMSGARKHSRARRTRWLRSSRLIGLPTIGCGIRQSSTSLAMKQRKPHLRARQ